MDSRTRRFNAELASLIGIQHIEVQYSINRIARQAMGIISRRLRFSLVDENLKSPKHIAYNIEIGFSEFASFVEKRIESLTTIYLRNMGRIFTSTLEKYSMLEAKRTINKTLFPGVPKNVILKIVANQRVADRLLKKMQKSGMNPSTMAAIVSLQTDTAKRQNLLEQYFRAMRNNAYTIARTSMSELIGKAGKIAYESLPKDLVGFQVHGILDERIRPAHRARNGTIYYKKPRYDNLGFDQMPNPPLEADGSMAYNCRCVTGDCRINGYVKSISRFLYDGEFTKIRTASGAEITVTSNHPIATNLGLVSANMINKGDSLITDFCDVGNFPKNVKNKVPTIKDVFESILVNGGRFSSFDSPKSLDFHGDGKFIKSKIDIVFADGELMNESQASPVRLINENGLVLAETVSMSIPDLTTTSIVSHSRPLNSFGNGLASRINSSFDKSGQETKRLALVGSSSINATSTYPVFLGKCVQGLASEISGNKVRRRFFELGESSRFRFSPQFDPKAGEPSSDSFAFDSNFSSYLLKRFARNISLDKVVEVTRFHKKDLVYSVDSHNGYYMASDNNIAIVNGNCWLTPIMSLDAQKFFDFKGRIIPNAKIFNEWFSTSSKDRRIMAVGVRRYNAAMKRLRKGEKLEWASMLDPVTGMLLDEKQLLAETPQKRAARIKKAKKVIGGT